MNLKPLWLFNQDSNLDKQDQNLLCYHYTIEQSQLLQRATPRSITGANIQTNFIPTSV